jgi:UDP-N-acetylglucosamine 2-epimerase (non-hydrolysing)
MRFTGAFDVRVCVTAQHRDMLDQVLRVFDVVPDYDLGAMRTGQTLTQSTARIVMGLEDVLRDERPALILVQGDTTTTFCGALAAFYAGVPTAHVEAGLRTFDMQAPFPEEMNRVIVGRLAALHFAATEKAKRNLLAEGVAEQAIAVTGNTGIDALLQVEGMLRRGTIESGRSWRELDPSRRLILVTAHRRESFGAGVEQICAALAQIAGMREVQIVYPVHPNPNVSGTVREKLSGVANILLLEPLDYVAFVDLMARSYLLLTDSGGVQEEGPSLGKPVLVMRSVTERPEAVEAGTAVLTGHDTTTIVEEVAKLLENHAEYDRRSRIHNPYGDGQASQRIADRVQDFLD